MAEFWEAAFVEKQLMWGHGPSRSALWASELFARAGVAQVLIPGVGYGRNAQPFLERGMAVTGIEIAETAIALARSALRLDFPIHHGSVCDMPYDDRLYEGIFCYGLLYLLAPAARAKFIVDCAAQLARGGQMIFTLIAKDAPMYGRGERLGEDWYEVLPGVQMYFYDADSLQREFGSYGELEITRIEEPTHGGAGLPFLNLRCLKR